VSPTSRSRPRSRAAEVQVSASVDQAEASSRVLVVASRRRRFDRSVRTVFRFTARSSEESRAVGFDQLRRADRAIPVAASPEGDSTHAGGGVPSSEKAGRPPETAVTSEEVVAIPPDQRVWSRVP